MVVGVDGELEVGGVAEGGDAAAQGDAFEGLVEDDYDGEGDEEGVSCDDEG